MSLGVARRETQAQQTTGTWTHFVKGLDAYHGALDHKDDLTKIFLRQNADSLSKNGYDLSGVGAILEALIEECCGIAAQREAPRGR